LKININFSYKKKYTKTNDEMIIIIKLKLIKYKKLRKQTNKTITIKEKKNHAVKNLHLRLAGETCAF
jgi:hypothetical protein